MALDRSKPCPQCGQIHTRCNGHKKHSHHRSNKTPPQLTPCQNYPPEGGVVCRQHGAAGTSTATGGGEREAREARLTLRRFGMPERNPLTALAALADKMLALQESAEHMALAEADGEIDNLSPTVRQELVKLIRDAAEITGLVAKLEIDDRLARIDEARAQAIATLIAEVLSTPAANLLPQQKKALESAAIRRLEALDVTYMEKTG